MSAGAGACDRCDGEVSGHRIRTVDYPMLSGLTNRVRLCRTCLRALDDFLRGDA